MNKPLKLWLGFLVLAAALFAAGLVVRIVAPESLPAWAGAAALPLGLSLALCFTLTTLLLRRSTARR